MTNDNILLYMSSTNCSMSSEATAEQPPHSASTIFARSLKKYQDTTFGPQNETQRVVAEFDDGLFNRTCHKASEGYDENKCNYDDIMCELFQVGEIWQSRDLVVRVVTSIAAKHGWVASKNRANIICNRYGEPKESEGARDFSNGPLQANCTLIIKLKALVNTSYFPESQNNKERKKLRYKPEWDQPVEIIKGTCTSHGGQCQPSRANMVASMSRAGTYQTKTPHSALFSLCNMAESCGKLTSSAIKNVMKTAWPSHKPITNQDTFYIRMKVMRLLPTFRKSNAEYEEFKRVVNCDDLLHGIDNEADLDDDEAYELGQSLWLEVLNTADTKEEAIMSFIEYLELIKCRAKGFTYKLAEEEDTTASGDKKKLVGVMWMTATMRRNFELFGGYICLDMMKRGLNTLLWPYCAVVMYDEHMQICLGCEGILCGERQDTYKFVAQFLSESAPGRPLSEVRIVAGDGFFDQEMIEEFGFVNARYIADRWHLLDSGLRKKFGKRAYELLSQHLTRMVEAATEEEFEEVLALAYVKLQAQPQREMQMEKDLEDFASCRSIYAEYLIAKIPGHLHRHGSSISESNHSSALVYLNDGNKQGNNFCEHPIVLIRELLQRQRKHLTEKNKLLYGDSRKMKSVINNLEQQPQTEETKDLMQAALDLNLPTYERYHSNHARKSQYYLDHEHVADPSFPQVLCTAVHSRVGGEPTRVFLSESSRCGCIDQLADEDMCVHEVVAKGGYNRKFFLPRHFARGKVTGSIVGCTDTPNRTAVDDLLGYVQEDIIFEQEDASEFFGDDTMEGHVDMLGNQNSIPSSSSSDVRAPKPGQLPSKSIGKVEPLRKKQVKNVLTSAIETYSRMHENDKFAMSEIVIQLQQLLTNAQDSSTVTNKSGVSVVVPSKSMIATQPKNRLLPAHESVKKRKTMSQSSSATVGMVEMSDGASGTVDGTVDVHGTVDGITHEIIINKKMPSKCTFCDGPGHNILSCRRKTQLGMYANEYVLIAADRASGTSLRQRLLEMPVIEGSGKGSAPFQSVANQYLYNNFIIHEARSMGIDRIWCVSFIGRDGEVMKGNLTERIWITYDAMNLLLTHLRKTKKKYVYDETILQ